MNAVFAALVVSALLILVVVATRLVLRFEAPRAQPTDCHGREVRGGSRHT
ncbi:hypothetical protein PV682_28485 [Streptomyces niveiscabiei]|nr:hypothetical protein [Streptomyces niveiscabiei]MDX3385380.1 hypothetical protein [Streptomyces niveiscabiei]